MIILKGGAEIVEGSSNSIEFGAIGFDIGKVTKFDIIELDFEMQNARGFVILKIFENAIPCIFGIIIRMNNTFKEINTNSGIKPSPNDIVKSLSLGIGRGCFRVVTGNNVIVNKMSTTMKFE